ncbi:hypothetical protein [Micromonospora sp. WMMD998]|nr:hypothetical protein [Micromonospora sp. WMMD998]WFE40244.1 hypothetical protein O7619_18080 [Micromonospora sp. WMMD998]
MSITPVPRLVQAGLAWLIAYEVFGNPDPTAPRCAPPDEARR